MFCMFFRCAADLGLVRMAVACVGGGAFAALYPGNFVAEVLIPGLSDALRDHHEWRAVRKLPDLESIGLLGADLQTEVSDAMRPVVERYCAYEPLGRVPAALKRTDTLYQNAWDPHSIVGNGNAGDRSLDGFFGRSTTMHFLCWPKTNPHMQYVKI